VIGLAAGVTWTVRRGTDQGARAQTVSGQPVVELSGRQAPAFTLVSATGQPYSFAPGDGKKHLFVFFMGYF
jgi:hypothetical protein